MDQMKIKIANDRLIKQLVTVITAEITWSRTGKKNNQLKQEEKTIVFSSSGILRNLQIS